MSIYKVPTTSTSLDNALGSTRKALEAAREQQNRYKNTQSPQGGQNTQSAVGVPAYVQASHGDVQGVRSPQGSQGQGVSLAEATAVQKASILDDIPDDLDAQHMVVFLMMARGQQIQEYISGIAQDQGNMEIETSELGQKLDHLQAVRKDVDKNQLRGVIEELKKSPSWFQTEKQLHDSGNSRETLDKLFKNAGSWWTNGEGYSTWDYNKHPTGQNSYISNVNLGDSVYVSRDLVSRAKTAGFDILAEAKYNDHSLGDLNDEYILVNANDLARMIHREQDAGTASKKKPKVMLEDSERQWFQEHGFQVPAADAESRVWDDFETTIGQRLENNQNQMQVTTRELTKLTHYMTEYREMAANLMGDAHKQTMAWVNALRF
ncbi:MAG: hypothetical protein GDA50_05255 [Alphaproteobacteria bacterium GM202ARS2]|nr:hypothetical protein [Alphaproteobacteria bacterium GM202ARS2]